MTPISPNPRQIEPSVTAVLRTASHILAAILSLILQFAIPRSLNPQWAGEFSCPAFALRFSNHTFGYPATTYTWSYDLGLANSLFAGTFAYSGFGAYLQHNTRFDFYRWLLLTIPSFVNCIVTVLLGIIIRLADNELTVHCPACLF